MSIHKKTKQNNNNNNLTIHTQSQKSTNKSAIWVNSNILKSVQDELHLKTALSFLSCGLFLESPKNLFGPKSVTYCVT